MLWIRFGENQKSLNNTNKNSHVMILVASLAIYISYHVSVFDPQSGQVKD